jgi:hypothetical protein
MPKGANQKLKLYYLSRILTRRFNPVLEVYHGEEV